MILIIKNGTFPTYIQRYLDEPSEIIESYTTDVSVLEIDGYSVIILLGSNQSIVDIHNNPPLQNVVSLVKKAMQIQKPVLGICLGCQIIAYALGCVIVPTGKVNIGYDCKVLGYENIFRCHRDKIVPNGKIEIIDETDGIIYTFCYQKMFGIQCHPDIPPETVNYFCNNYFDRDFLYDNKKIINKKNKELILKILKKLID
jgi:GMP synthase-like glutamine amidotransferase